jgi:hypothetical protein
MNRLAICRAAPLVAALVLLPRPGVAQTETTVTAGAAAVLPSGATFNGIALDGLRFGMLVIISSDGSATGQFQTTLLGRSDGGQPQNIEVEGESKSGSVTSAGSATFSGSCTIDVRDGTPPLKDVPFTVTVSSDGENKGTLRLVLGDKSLPAAKVKEGSMTIE